MAGIPPTFGQGNGTEARFPANRVIWNSDWRKARHERRSALIDHRAGDAHGRSLGSRKTERLADRVNRRLACFGESSPPGGRPRTDRHRMVPGQEAVCHVETERAIDFELFLREELIAGGLVGERVVTAGGGGEGGVSPW